MGVLTVIPTCTWGLCLDMRACARAPWSNVSQLFCLRAGVGIRGAQPDAAPMPWGWLADGARTWWAGGWTGEVAGALVGGGGVRSLLMLSHEVDSQICGLRRCFKWHRLRTSSETDTNAVDRGRCVTNGIYINAMKQLQALITPIFYSINFFSLINLAKIIMTWYVIPTSFFYPKTYVLTKISCFRAFCGPMNMLHLHNIVTA